MKISSMVLTGLMALIAHNISFAAELSGNQTASSPSVPEIFLIETSLGNIKIQLDKGPEKTDENFIHYVEKGSYSNTIFHRVIPGFMIQGGGLDADMQNVPTDAPVANEKQLCEKNDRGVVSMARTFEADSATNQFFINTKDNDFLNYRGETPQEIGYCGFAHVVAGMDVVDKIESVETTTKGPYQNVPVESVIIKSITAVK